MCFSRLHPPLQTTSKLSFYLVTGCSGNSFGACIFPPVSLAGNGLGDGRKPEGPLLYLLSNIGALLLQRGVHDAKKRHSAANPQHPPANVAIRGPGKEGLNQTTVFSGVLCIASVRVLYFCINAKYHIQGPAKAQGGTGGPAPMLVY